MFGYEHERVCFARIGECDGGMSATIMYMLKPHHIYRHCLLQTTESLRQKYTHNHM